jgi:hypothetical protein
MESESELQIPESAIQLRMVLPDAEQAAVLVLVY